MEIEEQIKSIINYLKIDLEDCENLNVACFPIFMTVSSGIDFIGGLVHENGFLNNSKIRFINFIIEYMGEINPIYSNENFAKYLYLFLRCNIIHEACINGDLYTENNDKFKNEHLKHYSDANSFKIYIHPLEFKNDFLKALDLFISKFFSDINFKNSVLSKFERRANEIESENSLHKENYPFNLVKTDYSGLDSTSFSQLRIEISNDEN